MVGWEDVSLSGPAATICTVILVHTCFLWLGRGREVLGRGVPRVCCLVNGHLQKSKFAEEFHSCLSTQALCPQISHMLMGVCTPVCLGHLSKEKEVEEPSVFVSPSAD